MICERHLALRGYSPRTRARKAELVKSAFLRQNDTIYSVTLPNMSYEDQKNALKGGGLRCTQLIDTLKKLGFIVKDGKLGGHKIVKHPGIREFFGSNFNCGHRNTDQVKPVYIRKMLKIVVQYEDDIRKHLGEIK